MVTQSIPLVADLRTQNRNIGTIYLATGLVTEGDTGGGIYFWNPASTNADDGFYYIQVTGVATGRWVRIYAGSNIYNTDGSLLDNRDVTLNGSYLSFIGSSSTTKFNADGSVTVGSLSGVSSRIVVANAIGTLGTQAFVPGTTIRFVEKFTATAGQTIFNTVNTLYNDLFDVFLNGVKLNDDSFNYTANQIVLDDASYVGDIIDVIGFSSATVYATLPSQVGNAGKYLTTDGTNLSWAAITGGFVPYTGATATVDLGDNDLEAGSVFVEGASGTGGALRIKQFASSAANLDGYSTISTLNTGVFYFTAATTSPNFKNFVLNPSGLTDNTLRTYTLPNLSGTLALLSDITPGLTSVGLSMPSAFAVSNSPLTSNGTIAVTGAGTSAQYVRGDGQLANFPDNGGGGSSVNYYLNGSVTQGTFGGDTYYEMSKTPVLGAGTNFTRTNAQGNGYIASFITDAGDPALLSIPGGNWNLEFYFQSSASGGSPQFYGEIYKVDASNNFTLVASGSTNPEGITNGTTIDQYFTSIPVPQTSLLVTDRLAIRIYVIPAGRTITLHTENSNLCEVLTTFSTGLNALNGLTAQVQYFAVGTSGTDFAISSSTDTHTFNLPTASATNRGALSSADWSTFSGKIGGSGVTGQVAYWNGTSSQTGSNNLFWNNTLTNLGIGFNNINTAWKLGVAGNVAIEGFLSFGSVVGSASNAYIQVSSTELNIYAHTSRILSFYANAAERARITTGGNLLVGTTTDGGQRLQVQGDAYIKGSGATSATTGLLVQNSAGSQIFTIKNDGSTSFGGPNVGAFLTTDKGQSINTGAGGMFLGYFATGDLGYVEVPSVTLGRPNNRLLNATSATQIMVSVVGNYSPTSGTGLFRAFEVVPTINQTGGANGITRGLYVNPTLTAAADWRSIEWSNNSGWGLYGAGTANNYLAGKLLIGTTTVSTFALDVNGTARVSGNTTITNGDLNLNTIPTNGAFASNLRIGTGFSIFGQAYASGGYQMYISGGGSGATDFSGGFSLNFGNTTNKILSIESTQISTTQKLVLGTYAEFNGGIGYNFRSYYSAPQIGFSFADGGGVEFVIRGSVSNANFLTTFTNGTIGINSNTSIASAQFQIQSTTKGFLPPRMTNAQRTAISSPAVGLIVYCTDATEGLYQYINNAWVNLTGVVTNRQTASYTLALGDINDLVEMNVATANNLTVPLNSSVAFPIGTKIDIAQYGAGQTTVVATSGVTVRSAGGALKLAVQYSGATLVKIGTDEWYLFGDITV